MTSLSSSRSLLAPLLVLLSLVSACGTRSSGPTCQSPRCAPACRPVYYGEDPSGCGVCLCGTQVCPPLLCDPVELGTDGGLVVDDAGCAGCGPP